MRAFALITLIKEKKKKKTKKKRKKERKKGEREKKRKKRKRYLTRRHVIGRAFIVSAAPPGVSPRDKEDTR